MGKNKMKNALEDLSSKENAWLVGTISALIAAGKTDSVLSLAAEYPEAIILKSSGRVEVHNLYSGHLEGQTSTVNRNMR